MCEDLKVYVDFLTLERDELQTRNGELLEIVYRQKGEIERLKRSYRIAVQDNADTCELLFKAENKLQEVRNMTIIDMAQRLKQSNIRSDGAMTFLVSFATIDAVMMEMLGEQK